MNATTIKCGNCKDYHPSVDAVRHCFQTRAAVRSPRTARSAATPASPASPVERPSQPLLPNVTDRHWVQVATDVQFANHPDSQLHPRQATERQVGYALALLDKKDHGLGQLFTELELNRFSREGISILIDALVKAPDRGGVKDQEPRAGSLPDVPAGRYAVVNQDGQGVKFYKVDRPTEGQWAGRVFVKIMASDAEYRVPAQRAILQMIFDQGVQECMLRYGREIKHCGHCGRKLTNDESRELGIGPICRTKMGW